MRRRQPMFFTLHQSRTTSPFAAESREERLVQFASSAARCEKILFTDFS
jgi:hypothetical protein